MQEKIVVRGARLHNLKNITVELPKNKLIVFSGLSGSGKSTLAFDILNREGQRQYMESLGFVTDGVSKPLLDSIEGLSPTISVDQYLTNRSPRSTVGTATEVFTYLRVLFAQLGERPCPKCGRRLPPSFLPASAEEDEPSDEMAVCPQCGNPFQELTMANFSFNKPAGACPTCTGLGVTTDANLANLIDKEKRIADGAIHGWEEFHISRYTQSLRNASKYYGFRCNPDQPLKDFSPEAWDYLLYGTEHPMFLRHYQEAKAPKNHAQGKFEGIVPNLLRRYALHIQDTPYREKMTRFILESACPDCHGSRLNQIGRTVTVDQKTIIEVSAYPLSRLTEWLDTLQSAYPPEAEAILSVVLKDLQGRVQRLLDAGVGYLTLDRASPSLSAGEAQRLRLAALLGSGLTGVLYVLDEPTIGLHPRDTERLISVLRKMRDLGNTILVIEHDISVIEAADHIVEIGPGAGRFGGEIVFAGTPDAIKECENSPTGKYLSHRLAFPKREHHAPGETAITIFGAKEHNLKDITARMPLGCLIAVTGPSGSGKSSLVFDILEREARRHFYGNTEAPGAFDRINGWQHLDAVITIDQDAIGRSTRSNAATYSDIFTPIREVYASEPEAKRRNFLARHFSFNVPGGRCERCQGAGTLSIPMQFLPDASVRCPVCHGRRFKKATLEVKFAGLDISQVLDLTVEEACAVFQKVPAAYSRLTIMNQVGLGYLPLGQPANTLSGGEAQRVKLAKELGRRPSERTLYLLDEPTTGLHAADTSRLTSVLQQLVDLGHTVLVVEHNMELIRASDWIIDLGPEGGELGGKIVAEGTPEMLAENLLSPTGRYLYK